MVDWTYNPEDYGKQNLIPEGIYRVRIDEARERVSKSGKDMYELVIKVSGQQSKVWYYLVFDGSTPERQQQTNNKLGAIFDSFDIPLSTGRVKLGQQGYVTDQTRMRNSGQMCTISLSD